MVKPFMRSSFCTAIFERCNLAGLIVLLAKCKIIHRDIAPTNIMRVASNVLLVDYSAAKVMIGPFDENSSVRASAESEIQKLTGNPISHYAQNK